ncbi:tyrosine--tRNA ligase [Dinghuibacter silviterrae]|uniref:Tyrosine--tRNA ligase n=1 Tax=Dinghuibacter silviterrae TaxID=1539049 RepID=A0A4R8DFI3_9BACT|nr:tyrosine--tRNA ligase [Dinghuibacter silviterrae]TDW95846.1 tyrosyl-tRNA synthetase [Dinghuibacter silviterrae]
MPKNLIQELQWRGMIQDITPGTEEQLTKEMTSAYIGFDPTADSLHIGSLVPILLLVHLQRSGHKPIALVGGATGMIGDPSFKSEERKLLDEATLLHNLSGIRAQLEQFLDFDPSLPNAAEVVNNYDWFKDMGFLQFIRDIGKHISVNYMMSKDSVRKRLDSDSGISFTEFTYQLIQGYDYYWLNAHKNCKIQMGGSDQWGNITTGTEIIRRMGGGEAFAFTCPLMTKADGGKFGKTEKGNVWLDPKKTSPYQFYQFWLNASDEDATKWIRIFTFLSQENVNELLSENQNEPGLRKLQKRLGKEVTTFVHGQEAYEFAVRASELLFANDTIGLLNELTETQLLEILEGVPTVSYPGNRLQEGVDIVSFLAETGIFPSKGEARKMVQGGGVSINKAKVEGTDNTLTLSSLLHDRYLLVQKGKTKYFLVKAE